MPAQPKPPSTTTSGPPSLASDDLDLLASGYTPAPSLPRRFTTFSLSFSLTCTWLGLSTSIGISLLECSTVGVIFAPLVAALFILILSLGMAELASAYPVAGAQYYWAFMVSNPEWRAGASFGVGWCAVLGNWLANGAVSQLIAGMVMALAREWNGNGGLEAEEW